MSLIGKSGQCLVVPAKQRLCSCTGGSVDGLCILYLQVPNYATHAAIKQSGSDHGRPSRGCAAAHEAVLIVCPFCTCKQRGSKHVIFPNVKWTFAGGNQGRPSRGCAAGGLIVGERIFVSMQDLRGIISGRHTAAKRYKRPLAAQLADSLLVRGPAVALP
eukprot:scaffold291619_cov21-Tisochrysis_lutea.AAC.1